MRFLISSSSTDLTEATGFRPELDLSNDVILNLS